MKEFTLTTGLAVLSSLLALSQLRIVIAITIGAFGVTSWWMTKSLIPKISQYMKNNKIYGYDINKKGSKQGQKQIPECVGFAAAVSFCLLSFLLTVILKLSSTNQHLTMHLAVFLTILGTILLGFADDMLDLPWRYKLLFPFFIVLPLLSVYEGKTSIGVIAPFAWILGNQLELGYLYCLYIVLLGIYTTNTINIYAGINGLQVGQSIIAASSMLIYLALDLALNNDPSKDYKSYSIFLLVVFVLAAVALMKENAYPSKIFIGDTFCYFAGIVLAIASIWGRLPIVCHWFLFPQLINFLYSTPQLFGIVPCPRHRLTQYNKQSNKLHAIKSNMNLLNLSLGILGPTNEGVLCLKLLIFQVLVSCIPIIHLVISNF